MSRCRLLGGLLAAGLLLLAGCATLAEKPEPPRVSLVSIRPLAVELIEQRYEVRLRVKNPNAFVLPIRGVDLRLVVNDEAFADGVSGEDVDVPAFGEAVIALQVTSSLLRAFRQLQTLESGQDGLSYHLEGAVAVGDAGLRLPFDYQGRLPTGQSRGEGDKSH